MTRKKSHTHQYICTYPKGRGVGPLRNRGQWACALPDCNHYLPGNMEPPVGKLSLCNGCFEPFVLEDTHMQMDKPVCDRCINPDFQKLPTDVDWERMEAKSYIANKLGKPMDEITEEEIDHMVRLRRLNYGKK